MDVPLFGDQPNKRRRQINLGGTHTATSHNDILHDAKLRRLQREEHKRRQDAALHIQRIWRSHLARATARQSLRATFDQDPSTLTALRCLVLLGQDEDALGRWSTLILASSKGQSSFFSFVSTSHRSRRCSPTSRPKLACTPPASLRYASPIPLCNPSVCLSVALSLILAENYLVRNTPKLTYKSSTCCCLTTPDALTSLDISSRTGSTRASDK